MSRTFRRNRKTGEKETDTYNKRTHSFGSCRHHGGCPWCEGNRTIWKRRAPPVIVEDSNE